MKRMLPLCGQRQCKSYLQKPSNLHRMLLRTLCHTMRTWQYGDKVRVYLVTASCVERGRRLCMSSTTDKVRVYLVTAVCEGELFARCRGHHSDSVMASTSGEPTLKMHTGEKQISTRIWLRQEGEMDMTQALEVGSRGFLNPEGFKHLFSSLERCSSKSRHHFLQDVSRKAILGSHRIWTLRNSLI